MMRWIAALLFACLVALVIGAAWALLLTEWQMTGVEP